jgi:hypothetical protein
VRRAARLAGLLLVAGACACASSNGPPTHFGKWGPVTPVQEPARSIVVAAVTAVTAGNPGSFVLARYAGDNYGRLDLASLHRQIPVLVDADGKLGPIDTGPPQYRVRVFEYDFPGRSTILELSAPKLRGDTATLTAWRWDALAWNCRLRGKSEKLTLKLEGGQWKVTATAADPGAVVLEAGCS